MGVLRWSTVDKGEIATDGQGKGTLTLRGLVFCDSPDDSIIVLRRDLPQFQRWQRHATEMGFFVDQSRFTQRGHTAIWEMQIDYIDTIEQDPLAIPARIGEVKSFTIPGATLVDYQGQPILNSAGEPPEPFDKPEQVLAYPIIKNIAGLGDWLYDFESVINQDAVRIGSKFCDPLTLMIRQITVSDEQHLGDIRYRTATVEVWRRKTKWQEYWPSRGFHELVEVSKALLAAESGNGIGSGLLTGTSKVKRPIVVNGEKPSEAQFLDRDGKWIKEPQPGDLHIITTQLYPAINFTNYFPLQ